ncbi:MAG TPA: hypothetical protein VGS21_01640 [Acidimicrobiales bacterium]|nr:hypothetical protein [Acidimicrobiales bacterium]
MSDDGYEQGDAAAHSPGPDRRSDAPHEPSAGGSQASWPRDTVIVALAATLLVAAIVGGLVGYVIGDHHAAAGKTGTSTSTTLPSSRGNNECKEWPGKTNAATVPTALKAAHPAPGAYIWKTFFTWHLEVVGLIGNVTGSVVGSGAVLTSKLTPGTHGKTAASNGVVDFQVTGTDTPSGIDFTAGCGTSSIAISVVTAGGLLSPHKIFVGGFELQPESDPFLVTRGTPFTSTTKSPAAKG